MMYIENNICNYEYIYMLKDFKRLLMLRMGSHGINTKTDVRSDL